MQFRKKVGYFPEAPASSKAGKTKDSYFNQYDTTERTAFEMAANKANLTDGVAACFLYREIKEKGYFDIDTKLYKFEEAQQKHIDDLIKSSEGK